MVISDLPTNEARWFTVVVPDDSNLLGWEVKLANITSGDPGVVVGRVEQITFDNAALRAKVTMRIDKRYEFPKDSSVSILTSGLLGDQFIGIDGGGDIELLQDGDRVRLTQSAIVLEKVIGQFLYGKAAEGGSGN